MNELVTFNNEIKEVTTTTLKVAEVFGKRHDRVLRAVNKILGDVRDIEDLTEHNFAPSNFTHPKNGVSNGLKNRVVKFGLATYTDSTGRKCNHYILNKEAFYLLVMGFTGKKALQFKLDFIRAFNQMERALNEKANLPAQVDMTAIGGMVKKCTAAAVRDEINKMVADESINNLVSLMITQIVNGRVQAELSARVDKIKALLG